MCAVANDLGQIPLDAYNLRLCLHPHANSHIQTQQEIEHFLVGTDHDLIWPFLDSGSVAYNSGDNIDLILRFGDRIDSVHLKQASPEVLWHVQEQHSLSFSGAVRWSVFIELLAGIPDPPASISELASLDVPTFVIAEQDLYPYSADVPLPIPSGPASPLMGAA
jgi:sugar phosphate isomerase/epimerase